MFHVGISGASSFTGYWIAKILSEKGCQVSSLFSRARNEYQGLRAERVQNAAGEPFFKIDATRGDIRRWIKEFRPQIWIHHYHWMQNFRSADYDLVRAREIALDPLPGIVSQLVESGCQGIIYSGTYCEPGEGGNQNSRLPYAHSKKEVWERLAELCRDQGMPLSKVVIPNPVGPLEDSERLTPALLAAAVHRTDFSVRTPDAKMDFIPIREIGEIYAKLSRDLVRGHSAIVRPSGWVGSVEEWCRKVLLEVAYRRLSWPEITLRANPVVAAECLRNPSDGTVSVDWKRFWDELAEDLRLRQEQDPRFNSY